MASPDDVGRGSEQVKQSRAIVGGLSAGVIIGGIVIIALGHIVVGLVMIVATVVMAGYSVMAG